MMSPAAEKELRAIAEIARGLAKAHGAKQVGICFSVIADRIEAVAEEHGELAWRRRVKARSQA